MRANTNLEELYDQHGTAVFALLLNLTRSETDTFDLLQDVFVKLATRPELIRTAHNPRAFLLRLAHNLAIDWMRRHHTRKQAIERLAAEPPILFEHPPSGLDESHLRLQTHFQT